MQKKCITNTSFLNITYFIVLTVHVQYNMGADVSSESHWIITFIDHLLIGYWTTLDFSETRAQEFLNTQIRAYRCCGQEVKLDASSSSSHPDTIKRNVSSNLRFLSQVMDSSVKQ